MTDLLFYLTLWCWLVMGIFMGLFIQKNCVLERFKARLKKKEENPC